MDTTWHLVLSFLSGLIPILVWLWFFEHEDKHPEPVRLLAGCFFGGMVAVFIALPIEQNIALIFDVEKNTSTVIWLWAITEEMLKFAFAYFIALRTMENNEPIDSMMYLIVTALGFSAMENAFFLFNPISNNNVLDAIITGNFRFIGASLLHVIASGVLGLFLAMSFYKKNSEKRGYVFAGLLAAIILHAIFNLSIIAFNGGDAIISFYLVWIAIVGILLAFEKVKQIKSSQNN